MRNRVLYYTSRLIGDQLKWGDDYNLLQQVVSIVICNHVLLDEEEAYASSYGLNNREGRSFTDLVKVVILELPKLSGAVDSGIWPWLRFFICESKEEFEMLAREHPELEEAVFCAKKMSLIDKWRDIQFHKNLWKVDERMLMEQARMDGREEGMEKGIKQEKLEIAQKMKATDRPQTEISQFTGLSLETIEQLAINNTSEQ
jgi:predicted transposase/invertase (TIGR01784 family)